jgi:hypothetical protein
MRDPLTADLSKYRYGSWDVTQRVYEVLGIKHNTIPRDMEGRFIVDGHTVVIYKSGQSPMMTEVRRYFHRMFFVLPDGRQVPTGRIKQALRRKVKHVCSEDNDFACDCGAK